MVDQNKLSKLFHDLFQLANDELNVAFMNANASGHLNVSNSDLEKLQLLTKHTLDAVFLRGCQTLDKIKVK